MTVEAVIALAVLAFVAGSYMLEHAAGFRRARVRHRVYKAIRATSGIRASKLATDLALSDVDVHAAIRALEDDSKIVTLPEDNRDRRCWILSDAR